MRELATAKAIARCSGDCYQFTAAVVFAVTGRDFRDRFEYRTARESRRVIQRAGGLLPLARAILGEPCHPSECDDGDPLIVLAGREMFGVKYQGSAVVRTRKFVQPLPISFAVYGWRL